MTLKKEGTALSSTVLNLLKIAYLNGSAVVQWTHSPHANRTDSTFNLNSTGGMGFGYCSSAYGSRPAFTLPASLYVSDDGEVTANTAPTTPGSITVPESIQGGSSVAISWAASTDAQNNLEGYVLQRSTDGGDTWTQIYQGGGTSTTNSVAFGTESVMYRVRAYDSAGLNSGWRTSPQRTVINNAAPNTPTSITVPEAVLGGNPLTISWGAGTDPDGNLTGYELERQVDGGAWTQIYKGTALTFTDAVTRGWETVAYRVRAYDSYNAYSGYAASAARIVNNNTPPGITCEWDSGASLGTKTEGFAVGYTVTDEEGDEVSVTEAVDGTALRTFTAQLGTANSFALTGLAFMKLLNGGHTMSVTADDGTTSSVHTLGFEKLVTKATVTLAQPMEADTAITICVLSVTGSIPAGAAFKVEVTNNAKDDAPVWENCTTEVKTGGNHIFANKIAANGFAFNFRLSAERGADGTGGYITSVQGGFQ